MGSCPTEAELEAALSTARGLERFTPHLDSCVSCSGLVSKLVARSVAFDVTTLRRGSTDEALAPARRIGRYVLSEVLGSGAMGVVYLAQDTTLARPVALKLLRSADPAARAALLHEARALARVTDPHVVAVYDVAEEGETLALAMEWVAGGTLGEWLREPRGWREVVRVLEGIARGLLSLHRNGLVHRDLKPANVLMDRDGKPRVSDFGLVHLLPEALRAGIDTAGVAGLAGTPAYMAPEQLRGELISPAADVYAFCAMAWEAVYGARHRTARSFDALVASALDAPPPSPRSELPSSVARMLRRGLSVDPVARPSMDELLRAFERALHPVRARAWVFAAAVVLVAVPTVAWVQHRRAACAEVATPAAALRTEPHLRTQREAFASTGVPYALTTFETAQRLKSQWLDGWSTARVEVCEAHQRGELSAAIFDESMACLDDGLREVAAVDEAWAQADLATVRRAVSSAATLPSLDGCRDRRAMQLRQPVPEDPVLRAQVDAHRAVLAKGVTQFAAGKLAESGATVLSVMGEIERTAYTPLLLEAGYQLGRVQMEQGKSVEAAKVFRKLTRDAMTARDERLEVRAWIALGTLVTQFNLGTPEERAEIVTYVEAVAARSGTPQDVRNQLDDIRVSFMIARGEYRQALELEQQLVDRARVQMGPHHIDTAVSLSNLGYVLNLQGRSAEAIAPLEESVAIRREQLGELHPVLGQSYNNLATALHQLSRYDEAATAYRNALSVFEASLGRDHPNVATVTSNLALIEEERGNFDEGLAMLDRSEAVYLSHLGPEHLSVARMTYYRGDIELRRGHWQAALDFAEAALAKYETALSPTHPKTAAVRALVAEAQLQLGHLDVASSLARRALEEHVAAGANREMEHDRRVLGTALLRAGKREEGLRALETAAAWFEKDPSEKAELARCGLELGGAQRTAACAFFAASPKGFPPEVAACAAPEKPR